MGELTATQIITEGGLLAGRDDLTARMQVLFPAWLDSVAVSWPWPVLKRLASGVTLPAGTSSLTIGSVAPVTDRVTRIYDNVWCYTADMKTRGRVRIRRQPTMPVNQITDTASSRAMPTDVRVSQSSSIYARQWVMEFYPVPDQTYLLAFDYAALPTVNLAAPVWYENDITSIHAVAALILEHADGVEQKSAMAAQSAVAQMVAQDRMRFGLAPGINDQMALDDSVFL